MRAHGQRQLEEAGRAEYEDRGVNRAEDDSVGNVLAAEALWT